MRVLLAVLPFAIALAALVPGALSVQTALNLANDRSSSIVAGCQATDPLCRPFTEDIDIRHA